MKYNKFTLLTFCFLLFLCSFSVFGAKIVQTSDPALKELQIIYPAFEYISVINNEVDNVILNFHVYNSSGYILTNSDISCKLHIYDLFGTHVVEEPLEFNDDDFFYNLTVSEFKMNAQYEYIVDCNNTQAGFLRASFDLHDFKLRPAEYIETTKIIFYSIIFFVIVLAYLGFAVSNKHVIVKIFIYFTILFVSIIPLYLTNMLVESNIMKIPSITITTYTTILFIFMLYWITWYARERIIGLSENRDKPD